MAPADGRTRRSRRPQQQAAISAAKTRPTQEPRTGWTRRARDDTTRRQSLAGPASRARDAPAAVLLLPALAGVAHTATVVRPASSGADRLAHRRTLQRRYQLRAAACLPSRSRPRSSPGCGGGQPTNRRPPTGGRHRARVAPPASRRSGRRRRLRARVASGPGADPCPSTRRLSPRRPTSLVRSDDVDSRANFSETYRGIDGQTVRGLGLDRRGARNGEGTRSRSRGCAATRRRRSRSLGRRPLADRLTGSRQPAGVGRLRRAPRSSGPARGRPRGRAAAPLPAHGGGEVVELERVGVGGLDLDALRLGAVAQDPQVRRAAVPRVGRDDRPRRRRPPRCADRLPTSKPQSNAPSTSPSKRSTPAKRASMSSPPVDGLGRDPLGLAGQQPERADAVAADVHQRPALELARPAHVAEPGRQVERRTPRGRRAASPTAPSRTSDTSFAVCGW